VFFELRKLARRLHYWRHRDRLQAELDQEMREHRERRAERLAEEGSQPGAERRAAAGFGNLTMLGEASRHVWLWRPVEELAQDLRFAARTMTRDPMFTLVAVAGLALGIGLATSAFTLINAIALKPLPVSEPDRTYRVVLRPRDGRWQPFHSVAELDHLRQQNQVWRDLAAYGWAGATLEYPGQDAVRVEGKIVSGNLFAALGARPALGRLLSPLDDRPQADRVLVLSHSTWQRRFDADPDIAGRRLLLNGFPYVVAGVAEANFATDMDIPEFYVTLARFDDLPRGIRRSADPAFFWLRIIGVAREGFTPAELASATTASAEAWQASLPRGQVPPFRLEVISAKLFSNPEDAQVAAAVLLPAVGLVLLIACANLTNLLLARGHSRRKEIGIRLSLGAGRARLIRQLLVESVFLTAAGGALGALIAHWFVRGARTWVLSLLPAQYGMFYIDFSQDWRILGFTICVCLVTGILFGLAPAFDASRPDLTAALKEEGRAGRILRPSWLRSTLVVAQMSACLLLLISVGVILRTVDMGSRRTAGMPIREVAVTYLPISELGYDAARSARAQDELLERLRQSPAVRQAALSSGFPQSGRWTSGLTIENQSPRPQMNARLNEVTPGWLAALDIALVRGRMFSNEEMRRGDRVAVINAGLAAELWAGADPIGKRFRVRETPDWMEVVGITRDLGQGSALLAGDRYQILIPLRRQRPIDVCVIVRSAGDGKAAFPVLREAIRATEPRAVAEIHTLEQLVEWTLLGPRLIAAGGALVGWLALLLASVGLYGVTAYVAGYRTHEIGIRMAIGARRADILKMVMKQGSRLVAMGIGAGLLLALLASLALRASFSGMHLLDPIAWLSVVVFLSVVALAAMFLPARRAAGVDPLRALRHD